jgi:thiamine-phosphate pyrophosphorylase
MCIVHGARYKRPVRDRQRLPALWLFTDARQGAALWTALARLPRGAGVVFRHYGAPDRAALAARVRAICRRRGLLFVVAGAPGLARAWRADGSHGRHRGALTAPAHDVADLVAARRAGARLAFLSPLRATRSHPGAAPLGRLRFGLNARRRGIAVAALGGVRPDEARALRRLGAAALGAIDGWEKRPRPGSGWGRGRFGSARPAGGHGAGACRRRWVR